MYFYLLKMALRSTEARMKRSTYSNWTEGYLAYMEERFLPPSVLLNYKLYFYSIILNQHIKRCHILGCRAPRMLVLIPNQSWSHALLNMSLYLLSGLWTSFPNFELVIVDHIYWMIMSFRKKGPQSAVHTLYMSSI